MKRVRYIFQSRACEHVVNAPNLFASAQCLGYRNENGRASTELCLPSEEIIIRQLRRVINQARGGSCPPCYETKVSFLFTFLKNQLFIYIFEEMQLVFDI